MSHGYDPAKQVGPLEFHSDTCCCAICGPSGNTTLIDQNEKSILEHHLSKFTTPKEAELGVSHSSFKQGIYTSNSPGDDY